MKRVSSPQVLLRSKLLQVKLHLKKQCDSLSPRQRKGLVYGLSAVYLVCSLWMIAQFFLPQQESLPIPKGRMMDSSIHADSTLTELHGKFYLQHHQIPNNYG